MRVLISEANVLAGRDVVFVADQLESEVVGERMAYDVNALPAFAGGSGVGYSLQPWIGPRRALGQRLARQEERELGVLLLVGVPRQRLQAERGRAERIEDGVELLWVHRARILSA